jgi:ubiquinone/menaquinone biosynthesis C-methylase UbiE
MGIDRDAYREQSLATWAEMAPGWEARHDWLVEATGVVNDWIVDAADPRPGQVFLDVASGPGDLGHLVAERVGAEGRVISSDFAPEMVDVARRFAEARGLANVQHRVLDAERLDLTDNSVDGVVCRFGFMLMADPAAALREARRVLRAGGPLAFAVWSTPERNPWAAIPAITLVQRGHLPPPEPGAPGIFSMGDPSRITELVTSAGFTEPESDEIAFDFRYADFEDIWDALIRLAGPLARAVAVLPDAEREATRAAIEQNVDAYQNADGSYSVPASAWGVRVR